VPIVARSGRTQEASALIVATFAEILEIAVATYANIERTNAKALRSRSYEPIAGRSGLTLMKSGPTAGTCEWIVATGEVTCAIIIETADGLGDTKGGRGKGERVKGKSRNE
jgi:hypothetical protein